MRLRESFSRNLVALFALFALGVGAGEGQQASSPDKRSGFHDTIDRFAEQLGADVEQDGIGGLTAAAVSGDSVIWVGGYGWADRDLHAPAKANTIYRTGSISKTFTAVLLLQLADRGVVELDDPVVQYLPEFAEVQGAPEEVAAITLRQLASHTGGLIREPELENAAAGPIEAWESKVVASIQHTSLRSKPGTEYSYSNIGFGILGLAISRAAGRPFMDLVTDLIFEPLRMSSSTFIIKGSMEHRLAVGYANRRDGTINTQAPALEHAGRGYKVPNGGVYSTVSDLGLFMAGISGASDDAILSEASRHEMMSVQTPEDPERGYGLGLSIRTNEDGVRLFGHGGSVAGYTAYMLFEPESTLGVVMLRNYNSGETNLGRAATELLVELMRSVESEPAGEVGN